MHQEIIAAILLARSQACTDVIWLLASRDPASADVDLATAEKVIAANDTTDCITPFISLPGCRALLASVLLARANT